MAENKFNTTVDSLFKGMDSFLTTKTVVGDVVHVNDTIIVPLVDVFFGVGAGAGNKSDKDNAWGGMGGKMRPSAVLVISKGVTKMIPVNQPQDAVSKIIDLVPDVMNKFSKSDGKMDPEVADAVSDIIKESSEE